MLSERDMSSVLTFKPKPMQLISMENLKIVKEI